MSLFRVLHAELLKLKRTLAFRMIFVAPLLVAMLQFFVVYRQRQFKPDFKLWEMVSNGSLSVWAIFMLPLLITLETALLNGIEHGEKQWKHLFALPIPRHAVYTAKLVVAQALAAASTLILSGLILVVGFALKQLRPELANAGSAPYGWILKHAAMVWLAAGLIIAIHTWVSIRWPGFALSLGVGIGGTFFALFAASAQIGKYYPWLLPVNVFMEGRVTAALLLGTIGGIVAAVIGCVEFIRRDVV
ncbi:MAG TPA: ABC transporter permease [Blastocatellia bacterium]|nr:ABC transporter permease [Blastocatellia bacterium]